MKKQIVLLITIPIIAGSLFFLWFYYDSHTFLQGKNQPARTIIPSTQDEKNIQSGIFQDTIAIDESRIQPLIPLEHDEIFVQAISTDLNKDGTIDQLCAIKKTGEQTVLLIPGLQNPVTGEYTRLKPLSTGITQTRTLLLFILDIIGDRTDALICSGMNAANHHVLTVFLPKQEDNGLISYTAIADLRSDGAISIAERVRSDAYNLGLTNGDSYPIHTYNSDPDSPQTLSQIERVFQWNRNLGRYEQISETRIEGKKLESKLVRQLQSGDIASFEQFLDGLWYIPSSEKNSGTRLIFFNTAEKEVIFHNGATEEVYIRDSGAPRRYGIFMTTRNKSISSIRRMIDIELTNIDEIKIKVQEDVKLKIGVASDWDGIYRKMGNSQTINFEPAEALVIELRTLFNAGSGEWKTSTGESLFFSGSTFIRTQGGQQESGKYAFLTVKESPVLQMKTDSSPSGKSFFLIEVIQRSTSKNQANQISLTPVTVSMKGISHTGQGSFTYILQDQSTKR